MRQCLCADGVIRALRLDRTDNILGEVNSGVAASGDLAQDAMFDEPIDVSLSLLRANAESCGDICGSDGGPLEKEVGELPESG